MNKENNNPNFFTHTTKFSRTTYIAIDISLKIKFVKNKFIKNMTTIEISRELMM